MKITMLGSGSYKSSLSTRLISLGKHLAKQGNAVTVILPGADKYNGFTFDKTAVIDGVRLVQPWQFDTHSATLNLLPYLLTSFIALLRSRPDVVYLYKPTPITALGLVFRLIPGKRVILDLDDLGSEVMRLQGQARIQVRLVAACEQIAVRFSSAIVVASTYLQSVIQQQVTNKPIIVLSNGVEVEDYHPNTALSPRPVVFYYGAINRLNLIEDLMRAWPAVARAVPGAKLHIIGDGSALGQAKELAESLGTSESVLFMGWIANEDLERYVQFGDIGICYQPDTPTVRAASNLKVFQYMALAAVPVVSNVGDLKHYVQHGQAGAVVAPSQPKKLAAALTELLEDTNKRVQLASAARRQADHTYSWQHLAEKLGVFIRANQAGKERTS